MSSSGEGEHQAGRVPVWNVANALTVLRLLLVPVFIVLLFDGRVGTQLLAAVVFALAAGTDKLDGHLARSRGLITDFGKIADPIADKALVLSALVGLSWLDLLPWWVTIVIAVRELGITLLRLVLVRRSVMPASKGGKIKTVLQVSFILVLLVPWGQIFADPAGAVANVVAWVLIILALGVTLATAVDYVVQAVRVARGPSRARGPEATAL